MAREFGHMPVMSHDNPEVDFDEFLRGYETPKKSGLSVELEWGTIKGFLDTLRLGQSLVRSHMHKIKWEFRYAKRKVGFLMSHIGKAISS